MENITVSQSSKKVDISLDIAASKSESNRALIIRALAGGKAELSNLANARDTETMQRLLSTNEEVRDVLDAGTTMRFCTAYYAISGNQHLMTGTERMQQRPIALLVDALRELGAEIEYQKNEGYPPHLIKGFDKSKAKSSLTIRGDVSSQYISALLMIAPSLPNGLTLELTGKVGSKPYIQMTLNLMEHFGVKADWKDNIISIPAQKYNDIAYTIEGDWSGASYWYSIVALAEEAEVELIGLR
jgi:3-phosphoshikimate 1-carboxyvinyltransferase